MEYGAHLPLMRRFDDAIPTLRSLLEGGSELTARAAVGAAARRSGSQAGAQHPAFVGLRDTDTVGLRACAKAGAERLFVRPLQDDVTQLELFPRTRGPARLALCA